MKKIRSKYMKGLYHALDYGLRIDTNGYYINVIKHNLGIRRFKVAYKNYKKQVTLQQLLKGIKQMSTIILGLYLLFGTVTFIRSTRKMDIKAINTSRYVKWFLITMVFWPILAVLDTLIMIGVVKAVTKKKDD